MAELQNTLGTVTPGRGTALAPIREPLFSTLWVAAVISYTGTWMQNLGAGWLMTSLTTSPLMVGLVQAATSLPVFLVVLPAGALADIVDRRRLLLFTQMWMVLAAASLGALTLAGAVTPWTLLLFTFFLGLGAVMNDPAWQAITPEIVSRRNLHSAVALNSAGFNVARAIGPAVGGAVIAAAGSGYAFLLNAASFFGVILFLYRWKRAPEHHAATVPTLRSALRAGFRYLRNSPPVQSVLVRTGLFSIFASAVWALLPLIAWPHGSVGFGLLLGSFGVGALAGATLIHPLRCRMSVDAMVASATLAFATATASLAYLKGFAALLGALFLGGGAWITILASLNVSAQTMSPAWVRARAISMYLLVLQGGMAGGSALWGAVADRWGMETSLLVAAGGLVAGLISIRWHRLRVHDVELTAPVTAPG